jgi:TRAP-type C4-dicarboxylate transport system permease small subunit
MRSTPWRKFLKGASIQRDLKDVRDLFVRYFKEQTLEPLKELGRFVAFGVAGSLFVAFGVVVGLIGVLRMLQDVFPVLDGSLSWIPYLVVVVLGVGVCLLVVQRIFAGAPRRSKGAR